MAAMTKKAKTAIANVRTKSKSVSITQDVGAAAGGWLAGSLGLAGASIGPVPVPLAVGALATWYGYKNGMKGGAFKHALIGAGKAMIPIYLFARGSEFAGNNVGGGILDSLGLGQG